MKPREGRAGSLSAPLARQTETPGALEPAYREALDQLVGARAVERLRDRDPSLWKDDPRHAAMIRQRLGWLDAPARLETRVEDLQSFAAQVRAERFTRVLLLGMGGSSLAPEVLQTVCIPGPGAPSFDVLDSTDPGVIVDVEEASRLDRTFFLVSSKSGRTIETLSQYRYFRSRVESSGVASPGHHFAAVTDEGSALDGIAVQEGFRRVFRNPTDVGGRYSALTDFGMVPAALLGLDLRGFAERAAAAREESLDGAPDRNAALRLAALLGAGARAGRDKLTLATGSALRPLGYWIEQLVAESTGKEGVGIIPVEGEPLGPVHHYGEDRLLVTITLREEPDADLDRLEAGWTSAGGPCARIELPDRDAVAGEFFRWEVATALAGALLQIDPFDEPNVQESKDNTEALLTALERTGTFPASEPRARSEGVDIHSPDPVWARIQAGAPSMPSLEMVLGRFLALAEAGEYLALLAYVGRSASAEASFALIRRAVRNARHLPVLQGYGPRYLHSIGQLFKGGPPKGLFIEITSDDRSDLPIPGRRFTFGQLKAAQALGDYEALAKRGRPLLRLHLSGGPETGLAAVANAMERAVSTPRRG